MSSIQISIQLCILLVGILFVFANKGYDLKLFSKIKLSFFIIGDETYSGDMIRNNRDEHIIRNVEQLSRIISRTYRDNLDTIIRVNGKYVNGYANVLDTVINKLSTLGDLSIYDSKMCFDIDIFSVSEIEDINVKSISAPPTISLLISKDSNKKHVLLLSFETTDKNVISLINN